MAAQGFSASTVLVVEDHPDCREAVVRILEDAGYLVTAVCTSFECLNLLSKGAEFDLIVSDIVMPESVPHGLALDRMPRTRHPRQKLLYLSGTLILSPQVSLAPSTRPCSPSPCMRRSYSTRCGASSWEKRSIAPELIQGLNPTVPTSQPLRGGWFSPAHG
jgi:CheY-like chemotaxis protein